MTNALAKKFPNSDPTHQVGEYRAWNIPKSTQLAFDMMWICIADSDNPQAHRVLPLGEPSLAVHRTRDKKGAITDVNLIVCGPCDYARWHRPAPRDELIAVRLKPELAGNHLSLAPRDYSNISPPAAPKKLIDQFSRTRRLAEHASAQEVVMAMQEDVFDYDAEKNTCAPLRRQPVENAAAAMLRQTNGNISIRQIAGLLDSSERHLRRRFLDALGCSPKFYARRLRVAAAAIAADGEIRPDWVRIALDAGFHDQPHMIGEFKTLTGLTPAKAHQERVQQAVPA